MSLGQTFNFVNIEVMGHIIYVTHVVFDAESESVIRIGVTLLDLEIEPPM
jgi:hypothetical protein